MINTELMSKNHELEERILALENEMRLEREKIDVEQKEEQKEDIVATAGEADLDPMSEQKTTPLEKHTSGR